MNAKPAMLVNIPRIASAVASGNAHDAERSIDPEQTLVSALQSHEGYCWHANRFVYCAQNSSSDWNSSFGGLVAGAGLVGTLEGDVVADGRLVGATLCNLVGVEVCWVVGAFVRVGDMVGLPATGATDGDTVGDLAGAAVGRFVGWVVGSIFGAPVVVAVVGWDVGERLDTGAKVGGKNVGPVVGRNVGKSEGNFVGVEANVGPVVGSAVGWILGDAVGSSVKFDDGAAVSNCACAPVCIDAKMKQYSTNIYLRGIGSGQFASPKLGRRRLRHCGRHIIVSPMAGISYSSEESLSLSFTKQCREMDLAWMACWLATGCGFVWQMQVAYGSRGCIWQPPEYLNSFKPVLAWVCSQVGSNVCLVCTVCTVCTTCSSSVVAWFSDGCLFDDGGSEFIIVRKQTIVAGIVFSVPLLSYTN
jgi:hypothetical protein